MKPNNLAAVRSKLGITKAALARDSGVSVKTIQRIEGRKGGPAKVETLNALVLSMRRQRILDDLEVVFEQVFPNG